MAGRDDLPRRPSSQYFTITGVGTRLFELLAGKASIDERSTPSWRSTRWTPAPPATTSRPDLGR
jgi:hypothetical protein